MIHAALLILTLAGFAALCLGNDRHQPDLFGARLFWRTSRRLRLAGWGLIALSGAFAVGALGGYGVVEWAGTLSLGAIASVLVLTRSSARRKRR